MQWSLIASEGQDRAFPVLAHSKCTGGQKQKKSILTRDRKLFFLYIKKSILIYKIIHKK
jgi:hypothetical protein